MTRILTSIALLALLFFAATPAYADSSLIPARILGKTDAPVTVDEYISLTCSHCAEFYNTTLPELEKRYVDKGKVRFILHDFPIDGVALKAAGLARCMPENEYYPFIKVLYKNQAAWAFGGDPDKILVQYATLGGLDGDKAKACLNDTKLQDAIITERTDASNKLNIQATPTFIVNNGAETIQGARPIEDFTTVFDQLLAEKK